jgi:hypothetical protein
LEKNFKTGDPLVAFSMLDEFDVDFDATLAQLKAYVASYQ